MGTQSWYNPIQCDGSEIVNIIKNWIQYEPASNFMWQCVCCIEDSRQIEQQLLEYGVNILNVSEKDKERRKNQAHPNIKNNQTDGWIDH